MKGISCLTLHFPHNHYTTPSTVTPSCIPFHVQQLSYFADSFHPSQMALDLSSQPSYYMYIFHTSPSNFHTSHTLLIILTPLNPIDPNPAISAHVVFPQSGQIRPEKRPFFQKIPHFSKREHTKMYPRP